MTATDTLHVIGPPPGSGGETHAPQPLALPLLAPPQLAPTARSTARRRAPAHSPLWLRGLALVATLSLLVPIAALVLRVDPASLWPLLSSHASLSAFWLSMWTATLSAALCAVFGIPLAFVLVRSQGRWARVLRAAVLAPLVLPPVVSGLALLSAWGRRGPIGQLLEPLGVQIAFTPVAVVLAQTFVAMPFLVLTIEGALRSIGSRFDAVAASLGARPATVFARVSIPLLWPAIASGMLLAFARALGEFGATLTFAGSLQGATRTLPLEIYLQREADAPAAIALSLVLVVAAVCIAVLAYRPAVGK